MLTRTYQFDKKKALVTSVSRNQSFLGNINEFDPFGRNIEDLKKCFGLRLLSRRKIASGKFKKKFIHSVSFFFFNTL